MCSFGVSQHTHRPRKINASTDRGYILCIRYTHTLVPVAGSAGQVITGNHETYLISADSSESADSWVAAIRRVMHEVSHTHLCTAHYVILLLPILYEQPFGGGMFGRSLEETLQVEARLGGSFVPVLVHKCVKFIKEHGKLTCTMAGRPAGQILCVL